MKNLIAGAFLTCFLLSSSASAQRAAAGHSGGPGFGLGSHGNNGVPGFPGFRPLAPFAHARAHRSFVGGPGWFGGYIAPGYFPWTSPAFPEDYSTGACDSSESYQPLQMAMMPPQPETPPPPPPNPPKPVIHEYNWPAGPPSASMFSLAAKDGTVVMASMVWVQDGAVHYTGSGGKSGSIALAALDRAATNRLNEAGNLHLILPPAAGAR